MQPNVSASCRLVLCYRITLLLTRLVGIFWSLSDFVGGQEPVPKPLEILATRRELRWAGYCRIVFICCAARRTADNSKPPSSSGLGLRPLTAPTPVQIRLGVRRCYNPNRLQHLAKLGCGVIGNTADSGSAILGSSPGIPANEALAEARAFLFLGAFSRRIRGL